MEESLGWLVSLVRDRVRRSACRMFEFEQIPSPLQRAKRSEAELKVSDETGPVFPKRWTRQMPEEK